METYYQNESIPLTFTIVDEDDNALDLDTLDDIEIKIFNKFDKSIMITCTLSGGTITKTDATSGICDIIIDGTYTNVRTGVYAAQVKTTETDANYTPKRYRYGQADVFILNSSV